MRETCSHWNACMQLLTRASPSLFAPSPQPCSPWVWSCSHMLLCSARHHGSLPTPPPLYPAAATKPAPGVGLEAWMAGCRLARLATAWTLAW